MPVGAGSIKRAAKLNADAEAKGSVKEATTTKKAATTKKAVIAKETAPVKKVATAKVTEEQVSGNQVCHLTEELPVYLL